MTGAGFLVCAVYMKWQEKHGDDKIKIGTAERLSVDSDLSVSAYGDAIKILKPEVGELMCIDLVLAFGPGCWWIA